MRARQGRPHGLCRSEGRTRPGATHGKHAAHLAAVRGGHHYGSCRCTETGTERPSGAGFRTQAPGIVPPPRGAQAGGPAVASCRWPCQILAPLGPPLLSPSPDLTLGMRKPQLREWLRDRHQVGSEKWGAGRPRASEDPSSVPATHVVRVHTQKQRLLPTGLGGGPQHPGAHACWQAAPTPGRGVASGSGFSWHSVPWPSGHPPPPRPCLPGPGPAHPTEPGAKQGMRGSPVSVDSEPPGGREPSQVPWLQQGSVRAGRPCPRGSRERSEDTQVHGKSC